MIMMVLLVWSRLPQAQETLQQVDGNHVSKITNHRTLQSEQHNIFFRIVYVRVHVHVFGPILIIIDEISQVKLLLSNKTIKKSNRRFLVLG